MEGRSAAAPHDVITSAWTRCTGHQDAQRRPGVTPAYGMGPITIHVLAPAAWRPRNGTMLISGGGWMVAVRFWDWRCSIKSGLLWVKRGGPKQQAFCTGVTACESLLFTGRTDSTHTSISLLITPRIRNKVVGDLPSSKLLLTAFLSLKFKFKFKMLYWHEIQQCKYCQSRWKSKTSKYSKYKYI